MEIINNTEPETSFGTCDGQDLSESMDIYSYLIRGNDTDGYLYKQLINT